QEHFAPLTTHHAPRTTDSMVMSSRYPVVRWSKDRQVYPIWNNANSIPKTERTDRVGFRLAERPQAGGMTQVFLLIEELGKSFLPSRISNRPGIKHPVRGNQVRTKRGPVPIKGGDGGVHPNAMNMDNVGIKIC